MPIERINRYTQLQQGNQIKNTVVQSPLIQNRQTTSGDSVDFSNALKEQKLSDKQEKVKKIRKEFEDIKKHQALIGKSWDGIKNLFGKDTGSEHVEKQIKAFEKGEITEEVLKALEEYKSGQEEVVDVTADIAAGVAALGIYTAAVIAAPFSGGTGIKYADATAKGKEYDSVGYDLATGAFSGVLAPVTGGLGGAVGKTVATKLGIQATSEIGKAIGKGGLKAATQNMLLNPTGYKYAGGSMLKRTTAFGTECAVDGAVGGSVDNMFRASLNGENVLEAGVAGFAGGLVMAPVIGGGIKCTGKVASSTIKKVSGSLLKKIDTTSVSKPAELQQAIAIEQSSSPQEIINDTIAFIPKSVETSKQSIETFIAEFKEMKNKDGKPRFDDSDIAFIVPIINEKNISLIKKIAQLVTKDGRELFSGQDISLIYTKINESHLILFDNCSKTELKELDEIFGTESFIEIEQYLFIPLLTELAQLTTKDGMPRFNSSEIVKVLNTSNEILNQILKVFVGLTTKDGILRFDNEGTVGCALHFKQKFIKTVIKLAQETIKDGKLKFDFDEIIKLASLSKTQFDAIKKLAKMTTKDGTAKFSLIDIMLLSEKSSIIENFEEIDSKVNAQVQLMLKEPEKYINGGDYQTVAEMQQVIQDYYCLDFGVIHLYIAASIFDKDSLNNLMRMRLDNAKVYMNSMLLMDDKKHQLLKDLCNTRNINGKEFCGNQKIELIDLLKAYDDSNLSYDKMYKMIEAGEIDLEELNSDLFIKIMKTSGLSDEEIATVSDERFKQWDLKLIHLLAKEVNESEEKLFNDIFRLGNFSDDFKKSIHDTSKPYGQANAQTKTIFAEAGMDYDKWITPSKENEVHFVARDKNLEQLSQIGEQLLEDIETLRKSPFIKKHIDANFQKCIKDGEFVIPSHILANKEQLTEFTNSLIEKLEKFWTMARGNLEKPNLAQRARNTLTILDHLQQRVKDIARVESSANTSKSVDLTIKMWDRNPQHDIFQGNYSTCCIGVGNGNCSAMPHYLMNISYNMIEMVDNKTGKTIGNALCFFVKDEHGKPVFIIDNIEVNNAHKTSEEIGVKLRNAITEYASKVAKEVTGNDETAIYMGHSYNDVPISDLQSSSQKIEFLGDVGIDADDKIYMDLYGGWIEKSNFAKKLKMLRLK